MSGAENRADVERRSTEPVTVVGAGPAGLACAIVLARAERRVVVREWHGDVGARFHGDFQGIENWSDERDVLDELAAGGVEASFEHNAVSHGIIYDSRGMPHPVSSDRSLYYLVRRGRETGCLDQELRRQAADAGVELIFKSRVSEIGSTQGTVVLAIGPRVADAIAVGYVFETNMADGKWLVLYSWLAPLGYAYLLIHRGRGTVASCMFTGFKQQADHVARPVAFFRERTGLDTRNPRPFGGFANIRPPRTAVQGGHPVVPTPGRLESGK